MILSSLSNGFVAFDSKRNTISEASSPIKRMRIIDD